MGSKDSIPGRQAKAPASSLLSNKVVYVAIIVIAMIASALAGAFASGNTGSPAAVPLQDCARTAISYLNANLVPPGSTAEQVSVSEKNGVYEVTIRYQGREIPIYATRDCTYLFTGSYNMTSSTTRVPTASPTPTPPPEPIRTARPTTELFVMSFCPYGVQAETAMEPVTRLLGTKAEIRVRYIATVQGTTLNSIKALHGLVEAKENIRQLCIAKYYPSQLWPYLLDFNANCYSLRQNATGMETCLAAATKKTGIDNAKIEACAAGPEGIELMKADEAETTANKITGSPTILINGQKYSGPRTADGYKQAICARFINPPPECSTNLSATATAAGGSCG